VRPDPIRVLLVDDHRMFAQAMELLLRGEEGMQVVGAAETGEAALELCRTTPVDVALVDIDLPGMDGIAVTARLRSVQPDVRVVIITAFQQPDVILRAVKAGASGYVMKTDVADALVDAIRMAMAGNMVLPAGKLAPALSLEGAWGEPRTGAGQPGPSPLPGSARRADGGPLSEREVQILQAIANGTSTGEMADILAISQHTVRTHVKRILSKLEVHSKAEAVMKGVRLGLITTGTSGP
jgi:DNA-binding NarL/FixJ family response regulator